MNQVTDNSSAAASGDVAAAPQGWRRVRFSLRTLLVAMALAAAFFGGRASMESPWGAPRAGTWQMRLTGGHQEPVPLVWLGEGRYLLGTHGVLGGTYRWKAGRLVVETPSDSRFVGLQWAWQGDDLLLVAEPPGTPAGPSYLGATLRFLTEDVSQAHELAHVLRVEQRDSAQAVPLPRIEELEPFVADPWQRIEPGQWMVQVRPSMGSFKVEMIRNDDGSFTMKGGVAMTGRYVVKGDRLVVVKSDDARMEGLAWAWKEGKLVLVAEPMPPPTGGSYRGTKLWRVGD